MLYIHIYIFKYFSIYFHISKYWGVEAINVKPVHSLYSFNSFNHGTYSFTSGKASRLRQSLLFLRRHIAAFGSGAARSWEACGCSDLRRGFGTSAPKPWHSLKVPPAT